MYLVISGMLVFSQFCPIDGGRAQLGTYPLQGMPSLELLSQTFINVAVGANDGISRPFVPRKACQGEQCPSVDTVSGLLEQEQSSYEPLESVKLDVLHSNDECSVFGV